jgi:hypothetical protein
VAVATAVAYGAWLAWDQTKDVAPDGSATGPFEAWQIVGLVVTLAVIGVVGGWLGRPVVTAFVAATTMGFCFMIDGATDPPQFNDGLFIVGAVFTWFGVLLFVLPVSCATAALVARLATARDPQRVATSTG